MNFAGPRLQNIVSIQKGDSRECEGETHLEEKNVEMIFVAEE